ncbi:MAG: cupin domain-containing protein [Acidimicrobiia bacterium]
MDRTDIDATSAPEQGSAASRRQFLGLAALATAGVVIVGTGVDHAHATPPSGDMTRTDLAVGRLKDGVTMAMHGPSDFHIVHVVLQPGADSGWHTHPGTALDIVTSGTMTWYFGGADCDPVTVDAGSAVFVPGGVAHKARNEGSKPADVYVTYLVAAGAVPRNDAAEPDNCTK